MWATLKSSPGLVIGEKAYIRSMVRDKQPHPIVRKKRLKAPVFQILIPRAALPKKKAAHLDAEDAADSVPQESLTFSQSIRHT
jgi:hypothetical protein